MVNTIVSLEISGKKCTLIDLLPIKTVVLYVAQNFAIVKSL